MNFADQLKSAVTRLVESGAVDVYDSGERLPQLSGFQHEVRQQSDRLILHLWTEHGNLVRRVLSILECRKDHLVLEVARFGKRQPGRLELVGLARSRDGSRLSRDQFRIHFQRLLQERFPDEVVDTLTTARDLEHSFSGSYVRGTMHRGSRTWAVMGVSSAETDEVCDNTLTYALLWLDWTRTHKVQVRKAITGLRILLPRGRATTTARRMRALNSSTKIELYEVDEQHGAVVPLDVTDAGNFDTWLTPRRDFRRAIESARDWIQRITALAPEAIDIVVPPGTREVAFRFRGLEFARWRENHVEFGLSRVPHTLTEASWASLKRLVRKLSRSRNPDSQQRNSNLFRAQPERWLESMVLQEPSSIDAHFRADHVYSQVPAFTGGDRGVIDLLTVRLDGRLAVVEIKASQDIHMVLQAADYWLRVRLHQERREFARYGYFCGVELQEKPPLLYLVAPGFQFHPAVEVILRYLSPEIEVTRIGLNEGWRHGIQLIFRQ